MDLGRAPLRILTGVFADHKRLVEYCRTALAVVANDVSELPTLAKSYLKTLASPNGNDILEEVCVRCTGREPKADAAKHGADSADGELEAKPMKTAYNAHISDDTPASLLRHQTIPYILLAEWTKDGCEPLWALTTSYRVFDNARWRGILATLPAEHRPAAQELPTDLEARRAALEDLVAIRERLVAERGIPRYVRANPLPVEALAELEAGQYVLWASDRIATSRGKAHRILWGLLQRQEAAGAVCLDEAFIAHTEAIRAYFSNGTA